MSTAIFHTPFDQHRDRNGQACSIISTIDSPDADHDAECLPILRIQFDDGTVIEAFPEEVT